MPTKKRVFGKSTDKKFATARSGRAPNPKAGKVPKGKKATLVSNAKQPTLKEITDRARKKKKAASSSAREKAISKGTPTKRKKPSAAREVAIARRSAPKRKPAAVAKEKAIAKAATTKRRKKVSPTKAPTRASTRNKVVAKKRKKQKGFDFAGSRSDPGR